jgi:hypothetical protein
LQPDLLMRRIFNVIIFLSCCLALSASADGGFRVPTMTRLVAEFQGKEVELIAALKAGNREKLNELVDPGFQLEAAIRGGADFVPYEHWLEVSFRQAPGYADRPLNMAVRELGEIAAVTFEWEVSPGSASQPPQRYHVTDFWKAREGNWWLTFRVVALVTPIKSGELPGQSKAKPSITKKY